MITPYFPEESQRYYHKYYTDQVGHGLNVFKGSTIHKGHGIGSFVGSLFRSTLPLLKSAGKTLGRELLRTGTSVATDALSGVDIGQSLAERSKESGVNLLNSLTQSISGKRSPSKRSHAKGTKRRKVAKSNSLFRNVNVKA